MNKFKVGDDVKHVLGEEIYTVVQVTEDGFYVSWDEHPYCIDHSEDRFYTLVDQTKQLPAKFKIRINSKEHGDVVQQWLFDQGYHWSVGKKELLHFSDTGFIHNGFVGDKSPQLNYTVNSYWDSLELVKVVEVVPTLSISGFTIVKEEKLVDILGKTYKQEDVEQALSGLEYKESV